MYLSELFLSNFRNFPEVSLQFPAVGAVILGVNGSGKTNLLEAVHLLCTGRSHRDAVRSQMIRFDYPVCHLEGAFDGDTVEKRRVSTGFDRDGRVSMTIDGKHISSLSAWVGGAAALSFGPDDVRLVLGLPRERRRFLDMLICQIDSEYLASLMRYRHALLNRNRILAHKVDIKQLDVYDEILAESGSKITAARRRITDFLAATLTPLYNEMTAGREAGSMRFLPSVEAGCVAENEWKNVFLKHTREARSADVQRGFSTIGPHRDDVLFCINGKPAREFGSRGQCRLLSFAVRLCSVLCAEHFMRRKPIFLIDDAFAELDHDRIRRIIPLVENRGQVFVASPTPPPLGEHLARFVVADNKVITV